MKGPSFWDLDRVSERFTPDLARAREEGRNAGVRSIEHQFPKGDGEGDRHLLIVIDLLMDFADDGRLPVAGTYDVARKVGQRIIDGITEEFWTDFIFTVDIHPPHAIHSDSWWRDGEGKAPDVSIPLQMQLVDPTARLFSALYPDGAPTGKEYKPRLMKHHTIKYAQHLETTNQGNIWVFATHCREGTDGVSLIPALAEVLEWACAARDIQPTFMYKGQLAETDWFGPFRPCMDVDHPQGSLQAVYLDTIKVVKTTDICGVAEDFCVHYGMVQVKEYYGGQPDVLNKIRFIEDCTAAIVPDNPMLEKFKEEMRSEGIQIIKHDEPFK